MDSLIPNYITHYYLPDRKPFLSLSDLSPDKLNEVLKELRERAERGETKRGFADWYVDERKKTEEHLKEQFIKKGGGPQRQFPIYFVLGKSDIQKSMDLSLMELKLELETFPEDIISFTYPDSMATMVLAEDSENKKSYHGQLFTYKEIIEVVKEYGFPKDEIAKTAKFLYPNYIEMQLWCDDPIVQYL